MAGTRTPSLIGGAETARALISDARFPVAGVDEVGRGPWAGPVVAAAVIFPGAPPPGLADSKRLSPSRRAALAEAILASGVTGLGQASVEEIDRLNILRAADLAMARALAALPGGAGCALVDGNRMPPALGCPGAAVVKGDGRIAEIAAASILAKVTRDRMMEALSHAHPHYGWERNMGYGTAEHRAGLEAHGISAHHRRSFRPIHNMLCEESIRDG